MGFLGRLFVPRGVRRAMHPVRTAKSAMTPRVVKQVRRALNPVDTLTYSMEREVATALRGKSRRRSSGVTYRHGSCPVRHRTREAAAKCRNP